VVNLTGRYLHFRHNQSGSAVQCFQRHPKTVGYGKFRTIKLIFIARMISLRDDISRKICPRTVTST